MMDEYQFSFWYETLWVMDWGLNDADTYAFDAGAIFRWSIWPASWPTAGSSIRMPVL